MGRPKSGAVEVTEPGPSITVEETGPSIPSSAEGKNPGPEFVTMETFDQALHQIGAQFSAIREEYEQRISDLETLVSQPTGSVQFLDVHRDIQAPQPGDDAPWFEPKY